MRRQSWLNLKVKPVDKEQDLAKIINKDGNATGLNLNVYKGVSNEFESQPNVGIDPSPEAAAFGKAN